MVAWIESLPAYWWPCRRLERDRLLHHAGVWGATDVWLHGPPLVALVGWERLHAQEVICHVFRAPILGPLDDLRVDLPRFGRPRIIYARTSVRSHQHGDLFTLAPFGTGKTWLLG